MHTTNEDLNLYLYVPFFKKGKEIFLQFSQEYITFYTFLSSCNFKDLMFMLEIISIMLTSQRS